MVKSRNMVGAFLELDDKILMICRDAGKELEPSKWTGVGGHIEANEINDPLAACLREIEEETGIMQSNIRDLQLRYITINYKHNEIRIAYYFFGRLAEHQHIIDTNEGSLQWIPKNAIFSYNLSNAIRYILEHWVHCDNIDNIYVCTINNETHQVQIAQI